MMMFWRIIKQHLSAKKANSIYLRSETMREDIRQHQSLEAVYNAQQGLCRRLPKQISERQCLAMPYKALFNASSYPR